MRAKALEVNYVCMQSLKKDVMIAERWQMMKARRNAPYKASSFIRVVKILVEYFGHREHMNTVLFENWAHELITSNVTAVCGILKVVLTDIFPYFLDSLWSRELLCINNELFSTKWHGMRA